MNAAVAELARMIEEATGFVVPRRSYGQLAAVAREQVASLKLNGIEQFMDLLSVKADSPEWRQLLAKITVKESYLFRGSAQFTALGSTILDEFSVIRSDRRLRVWCAGCARGEEAVTLAIVLDSHPIVKRWDWSVLATDVDDQALEEARLGRYGERAVAAVPESILASRFERKGDRFLVEPGLLGRITYRKLNLVDRDAIVGAGPFDVIFLRNVLIYFRPDLQRRVVQTVERSLAPDGVLFLGPSESLLSLDATLRPRDLGSSFCYRWPPSDPGQRADIGADRPIRGPQGTGRRDPTDRPLPPATTGSRELWNPSDEPVRRLLDALEAADFETARGIALTLRHEFPENPTTHALVGFVASRMTDFEAAVLAYRGALYLDPASPEIRFLMAVALEGDGRLDRAQREYRSALGVLGSAPLGTQPIFKHLGLPGRDQLLSICRKKISEFNI